MQQQLWTISELADAFNVSTRTIRFYEDKGLLHPQRIGTNRVFNYQDRARLQLILRGKRLGFSLEQIKQFIDLYKSSVDPLKAEQIQYLLQNVSTQAEQLRQQLKDLTLTLQELDSIAAQCQEALKHSA